MGELFESHSTTHPLKLISRANQPFVSCSYSRHHRITKIIPTICKAGQNNVTEQNRAHFNRIFSWQSYLTFTHSTFKLSLSCHWKIVISSASLVYYSTVYQHSGDKSWWVETYNAFIIKCDRSTVPPRTFTSSSTDWRRLQPLAYIIYTFIVWGEGANYLHGCRQWLVDGFSQWWSEINSK